MTIGIIGRYSFAPIEPWPLHSGTNDLRKYYDGPELPLEQLAILHVRRPFCIKIDDKYYRKSFLIQPGRNVINISLFGFTDVGASVFSDDEVSVKFYAKPRHIYRFIHIDYFEISQYIKTDVNVWKPMIIDITDDDTILDVINECQFPTVREKVLGLIRNMNYVSSISQNDPDESVRKAAEKKLASMNLREKLQSKFPDENSLCEKILELNNTQLLTECIISGLGSLVKPCAKQQLQTLVDKRRSATKTAAKKSISWLKHNGRWE